ncbi:MAG: trypsin-like peptidase domain-containing protein [Steroidobacteraceae bacterium]|jgi:serine protease DegS
MKLQQLRHSAVFLIGAITGGLALAFVAVLLDPRLLPRRSLPVTPARAVSAGPAGSASSAPTAADTAPAPDPQVMHSFAAAVHRAAPAVVNIYTRSVVHEQVRPSALQQFFGDFGPLERNRVQQSLGSGVIIDAAGHVVTNNHVIANATDVSVLLADGRLTRATIVGRDPDTDLAVLSINLKNLPVMPLGRSDHLQVGDEVLAIGEPLGLTQTVTHGIVSATQRRQLGLANFEDFIQTDAAINEGNSGGALINAQGELIGINTAVIAKNSDTTGVEGIGFAIPVNMVRGVLQQILDHGRVIRGWIGVVGEYLSDEQAREVGLQRGGAVVTNMYRDSPAVSAGIQTGDVILQVDGHDVRNWQEALERIADIKPGTSVHLQLLRGTQTQNLALKVAESPRAS